MAKVILLSGKICAGKTTYARLLLQSSPAVYISTDELMLRLFPEPLGDQYDAVLARAHQYLYERTADIVQAGLDVVFDGAAWKRADRQRSSHFFKEKAIPFEWHYIDVSDQIWKMHIESRNREVQTGRSDAYFVDKGLIEKCLEQFEPPKQDEMDVWILNE